MPIANIIHARTNPFNNEIMAILEDSWHDNVVKDSTKFKHGLLEIEYMGIKYTTIPDVIAFVNQEYSHAITLYMYDIDTYNCIDYETIEKKDNIYYLVKK